METYGLSMLLAILAIMTSSQGKQFSMILFFSECDGVAGDCGISCVFSEELP